MEPEALIDLVEEGVRASALSARQASLRTAGHDGLIRDIKKGVIPSYITAIKLLENLGYVIRIDRPAGKPNDYEPSASKAEEEFALIPRLDITPSAGPGAASEGEPLATGLYSFRRTWLTKQGWDPQHLHLVQADGDSMEPTIPDGSAVLVDTREATRAHLTSAIYVLRIPDATGSVVIKRLQEAPANRLLISSDNLAYKDIPIPAEERDQVRIIGRAVWAGRRL